MTLRNYRDQLRKIASEYQTQGQKWPATSRQIAEWAIRAGRWRPQPADLISRCASEISSAMREEYYTDPQGRSVRTKHAARVMRNGEQIVLWDDIRTAPRTHMASALQQRRNQVLGDCRQLNKDIDSFNENRLEERPIQMSFNFDLDLEEEALSAAV